MPLINLKYNGDGNIEPADKESVALFRHCSEGSESVTQTYYTEEVEPVLRAHSAIISLKKNGA